MEESSTLWSPIEGVVCESKCAVGVWRGTYAGQQVIVKFFPHHFVLDHFDLERAILTDFLLKKERFPQLLHSERYYPDSRTCDYPGDETTFRFIGGLLVLKYFPGQVLKYCNAGYVADPLPYIAQFVNDLVCIHAMGLVHDDLFLRNIVIDKEAKDLFIIDFGSAFSVLDTRYQSNRIACVEGDCVQADLQGARFIILHLLSIGHDGLCREDIEQALATCTKHTPLNEWPERLKSFLQGHPRRIKL